MKKIILYTLILFSSSKLFSQELTQNIRGTVIDMQSKAPLAGATVVYLKDGDQKGTITDEGGHFKLEDIPIGRVSVQVSYLGYETITMNNLILNSAKELILNVELKEKVKNIKEVVVKVKTDKKQPLNKMATVSARSFTIEETQRYAGALNDPSRMAANYAGVGTAGDSRNDIIIRGNSPLGLLWRLDGINIPNPNHFGSLGTTGGPVSILNNNLLDNSDFFTGAFPAEYGNALSGAFDLRMRTGNNEQREFIGQVGFNGFELAAEGPLGVSKGSSYLASYRYSTLDFLYALGIDVGYGSIPQYQDLSFKIDIPTGVKTGRFSLFGIGGISYIELLESEKQDDDFTVTGSNQDTYYGSDMGVIGLNHHIFYNSTTRATTSLAISGVRNKIKVDTLFDNSDLKRLRYGNNSYETKYTFSYDLNKKFNARNNINAGVIIDYYSYYYKDSVYDAARYRTLTNFDGNSFLIQTYAQWQHRFSDAVTLNAGIHHQHFSLNNSFAVEPRAGLKWQFKPNQALSFGTGLHSQIQPSSVYFYETYYRSTGEYYRTNKDLEMSKSAHFVLGYDNSLSTNMRIKVETYYQHLYNIPVEQRSTSFSVLNIGADFVIPNVDSLENEGTGKNYGIELTLEKFFSKNYYFLITASLFDSKYKGSDGVERNTAFNGNYTFNALAGVELELDKNRKKILGLNGKVTYAGGKRYTPINLEASKVKGEAVYYDQRAYEKQYDDYFRTDVRFSFKLNGKKITQEWALDVENIFGTQNIFQRIYDPGAEEVKTEYQLGVFPMFLYRIYF